jgi:hypothetical protein
VFASDIIRLKEGYIMLVSLKEYAKIHNIPYCNVRSYVSRGKLPVVKKEGWYAYVDSEFELDVRNAYVKKYGPQPRLSNIRRQMMSRCYNKNNPKYKVYGGRGIKVCKKWREDTTAFIEWAINNGYREDLTLDRINNDSHYCPDNCRWITRSQNSHKRAIDNRINRIKRL